ncbi:hypothetical protein [Eubacterium sp. F2]|uniref:hypothetical protein n=1 Tax=Eubacterium sp. F2 TaxID=3381348 RepID=UPI003908045B
MDNDFDSAQKGMAAYIKQMDMTRRNTDEEAQEFAVDEEPAQKNNGQPEGDSYRQAVNSLQDWQSQLSGIQAGDLDESDFDREGEKIQQEVRSRAKQRAAAMSEEEKREFLDSLTDAEQDMLAASPHAVISGWQNDELYHLRLSERYYTLYQQEKQESDRSRWLLMMSACYLQLAGQYASDYDRFQRAFEVNTRLGPFWSSQIADLDDEADIFPMIQETNEIVSTYAELMDGPDRTKSTR